MLFKIEKPYTILLIVTSIISVCPELFKHLFHGKIVDELAAGRNLNLIVLYVLITLAGNMLLSLITSALVKTRSYHQNQFYKNEQMFLADKLYPWITAILETGRPGCCLNKLKLKAIRI